MANKRNFIILDTETTGLKPEEGAEVIQIAATAINCTDFDVHHAGEIELLIKPQNPELAQAKAIEIVGPLWKRANEEGLHPKVCFQKFYDYIQTVDTDHNVMTKPIVVAYNTEFDITHLIHNFLKYKIVDSVDDMPWARMYLDVQQIAFFLFESDVTVHNFKLDTFLQKLGRSRSSNKHDAMEDVRETAQGFIRAMKFFRACRSKMKIA